MSGHQNELGCTLEQFRKDTADHQMTVLLDQGTHRHLRFRNPAFSAYWFDLITAPGVLLITGDCGDFAFRRLDDMFAFFRPESGLSINRGYWLEKCTAEDRSTHGATEFSPRRFWGFVVSQFKRRFARVGTGRWDGWEDLKGDAASLTNEFECVSAVYGYKWSLDWCDAPELRDYSFHYEWCLWAIVWGISQYDASKPA